MLLATTPTVGIGFTVKATVPLPEHVPSLTEMEYTVDTVGATTAIEVLTLLGNQVYVVADAVANNVAAEPAHVRVGVMDVTTGSGATVMAVVVVVIPHPF